MKETKFNFAYVLCIIVLLFFSYITFLGLAFWAGGSMVAPVLLTLLLLIIVGGCVFAMSVARSSRWTDVGLIGQICCGIVVLAALMASSLPFTNFMRVAGEKKELQEKMEQTMKSSEDLNSAYDRYVQQRLSSYRTTVSALAMSPSSNPSLYAQIFGDTPTAQASGKVNSIVESLKSKLLPPGSENIQQERQEWLKKVTDINVWNPLAASNIAKLNKQVNSWDENYKQLSSTIYAGEKVEPFEYNDFQNSFQQLTESYEKFRKPNVTSLLVALFCFLVMLFPYFISRGSLAAKKSNYSSQIYE